MPQFCRENKNHTAKIADILAQLLIVEDTGELQQVHIALQTILKVDFNFYWKLFKKKIVFLI